MNSTNTERLHVAETELAEAVARLDTLGARMDKLREVGDQRRSDVRMLEAPREARRSLLARLLRADRIPDADERARLASLDGADARTVAAIAHASDEAQAVAAVLAELQQEAGELHPQIAAHRTAVAEARAVCAREAFEQQHVAEFIGELQRFRLALARVIGAENATARLEAAAAVARPGNEVLVRLGTIARDPLLRTQQVRFDVPGIRAGDRLTAGTVPGVSGLGYHTVVLSFGTEARQVSDELVGLANREGSA